MTFLNTLLASAATQIRIADEVVVKRLTLQEIINNIIRVLAPIAGVVIFGMIIWSGYLFITSEGQPEKIQKARLALTYAVIGVIVIALSAMIVLYIISNLKA